MAYYLAGDYYLSAAGDPGIFGFIGKAIGSVAKVAGGLLPGPLGGVARTVGRALAPSRTTAYGGPMIPLAVPSSGGGLFSRLRTAGQALAPGGVEPGAGCPPGYHLDKTTGSKCVKNRRMNPGNARALRRAIRREASFVGLAKRTLRGSGYTFKRTGVARKRRR